MAKIELDRAIEHQAETGVCCVSGFN